MALCPTGDRHSALAARVSDAVQLGSARPFGDDHQTVFDGSAKGCADGFLGVLPGERRFDLAAAEWGAIGGFGEQRDHLGQCGLGLGIKS
jgi:hypothetical protein